MNALVTGGGGFLGGQIVRMLREQGHTVRSLTRTCYSWLNEIGVTQSFADLADASSVADAVKGCDVVFHVAAKAGAWGRYADYYDTNVTGTANIVAGCQQHGIRKLIYTSTPSVVHTGGDIQGGNESLPYAKHFHAAYPETKARAEKLVLAANSTTLATVALRPHLIWGPGDPHLIPRIVARARAGKLKRLGQHDVVVDTTFVDNAAKGHLQAEQMLSPQSALAGKAYFLSDGNPVNLWAFINRILATSELPPVTKSISTWKAMLAGRVLERVYSLFRLSGEPAMTRFVASQLSTCHWFDISAAKRDFGYEPQVTIEEGLKRLTPAK